MKQEKLYFINKFRMFPDRIKIFAGKIRMFTVRMFTRGIPAFVRKYKRLHIWLAVNLCAFAAYFLCRGNRVWMNFLTQRVTGPAERFLGRVCSHTRLSVMEITTALAVLFAGAYIVRNALAILRGPSQTEHVSRKPTDQINYESASQTDRRKWRLEHVYTAILGGVCAVMSIQALFCLTWGINYWSDGFQERSGIYARPISTEELQSVTEYFAGKVSQTADSVPRDENHVFAVPREEILSKAPEIYNGIEKIYPFLEFDDIGVKSMAFSRIMSRMNFTGFYCSWTGEANVNTDSPACLLGSTAAHEMAHQRGIASEQECNFLAVLACLSSHDPVYTYSGYLMGYIYLGNALWETDQDAYRTIRDTLPETVRADLRNNNAYWAQFEDTVVQTVSNTVYDGILKGYGDSRGIRSYGAMVDLLAIYDWNTFEKQISVSGGV